MAQVAVAGRLLLLVVFAVAGVAKLADRPATRRSVQGFGVPAALVPAVSWVLPVTELVVAAALVPGVSARGAAGAALVLLCVFCVAATVSLLRGRRPDCNCFGQVRSEPVGPALLVRNVGFAALALLVVAAERGSTLPDLWSGAEAWTAAEVVLATTIGLLVVVVILQGLRLRSIGEAHDRIADSLAALTSAGQHSSTESPSVPAYPPGLPVGSPAPTFSLASAAEEQDGLPAARTSLVDLLVVGKPVVLVFVSPNCGSCHDLLPKLAGWATSYGDALAFAVVTVGPPEANEGTAELAAGFGPILFDLDGVGTAYGLAATPGALVIASDGTVASSTVYGTMDIAILVMRSAAGARSRVEQPRAFPAESLEGPPAGIPPRRLIDQ